MALSLEDFFKQRSESASLGEQPMDVDKVEKLKSMFSLNKSEPSVNNTERPYFPEQTPEVQAKPEQVSQSVKNENFVPTSDLLDAEKISQQADAMMASRRQPSNFIPYLAPIALEALLGKNTGGMSLGLAGDAILQKEAADLKRKDELENKLMEINKARMLAEAKAKGSEKPLTKSNVITVDENGEPVIKPIKEAIGAKEWQKLSTGLTFEQKKALKELGYSHQDIQKEEDRKIAAGARFEQKLDLDPVFKDYKNQLTQSQRALDLLAMGKGVADAGARTTFAKGIFGEVGNLAIQEQEAVSGSPMIAQKYNTLWKRWTEGTLGDADRADMIEVAAAIRNHAPKVLRKIAYQRAEAEKAISGFDVSDIAKALSKDQTTHETTVKVVYKGRVKEIPAHKFPEAMKLDPTLKIYTGK